MNDFKYAIGFLTRWPLGRNFKHESSLSGAAVSWYGVVGFLIALLLVVLSLLAQKLFSLPTMVVAALIVAGWAGITGALHLDGLGDCADAWMGGHDSNARLAIMKDTHCGIGAIVAVACLLMVKFAAIVALLNSDAVLAIIFACVIARTGLSATIAFFPYVRANGLGASAKESVQWKGVWVNGLAVICILAVISFQGLIVSIIGWLIAFTMVYLALVRSIKGFTGDIYGALIEVSEAFVLVALTVLV